ncbi:MAG: hypothetical protein A2X35_13035 [Elusimicrobia bacterium GWA2_61_42]|nr:MAG: hypothetical protein A2X35_13035 [Elusimicrobia bacterium GWA2_61_42]OGR77465.1 MAG: hypothetical protein A2X38_10305 [Elusimicrobia bacterium GWC2_61_25]
MVNKLLLSSLLAAACLAAHCPAPAAAQANTPVEEQSFDYTPAAGEQTPEIQQSMAETTFEDAELINHPVYGTILLSKHRWKSWVARALYLAMINIALMVIVISLSKTEEYNLIISYILAGSSFALSLWMLMCALLLFQLNSLAWTYVGPVALVTLAICYVVLMKIKKYDVSLTELKESFQKMRAASREDQRLASVDGSPGDWPEQDFIR